MDMTKSPIAIDPPGCSCTGCLTGEYVPLDRAPNKLIKKMLKGKIRNNTGSEPQVYVSVQFYCAGIMRSWAGKSLPFVWQSGER